jgi:hypothetical protein
MAKKKKVAETLKTILDNPVMEVIRDRAQDIDAVFEEVNSWWGYDLLKRKPGPACVDENFVGTDLDLACFLYELSRRNAVINIPSYKSMRATKLKEGQGVISKDNRHGCVLGLAANKDVFSFSLRIKDMNVISTDKVGDYRNFSITDLDGDWYPGWSNLEFIPTAKENKFIFENKLAVDNNIYFKNFVHPNRWSSLFGQFYFMTKALINRLKEECQYYNKEIKSMLDEGIKYPTKDAPMDWPESEKIPGKKVKVKSFEVELDVPDNDSKYPTYKHNVKNLVELTNKRKYFTYKVIPDFNFAVRTVEYSYYKFGNDRIPGWISNTPWENNYVVPGKRTKWDRMVLFQDKVGEVGISIKKRIYETTQEVALGYDHRKGKLKNYVAIILDESGSMNSIREETIGAFNQQVETIKANAHDMETSVSLVTFNTFVDKPKIWNQSEMSLKPITLKDYVPRGMTALYDAVGETIDKLNKVEDINEPDTSFLLVILSDGEENASKNYNYKTIAEKISGVQNTKKWTITFIGANQDMQQLSKQLHIPVGNVTAFAATSRGVKDAGFTVTMGLNNYYKSRRDGETMMSSFYVDDSKKKD